MVPTADPIPEAAPSSPSRPSVPWAAIAWFAVLLIANYYPTLVALIKQWSSDEDMGHGFFVPVIAAYIAWQRREQLLAGPATPGYWALALMLWGGVQLTIATLGAELFLARTAFVVSVIGAVAFMGGLHALRVLGFPLALLFFMVPLPAIVYNSLTLPLQLFASRIAEFTLSLFGVPVLREGNVLELASQRLSVVEACSGIRSLLSLSFLSLVYGYFFDRRGWMRPVLLIATVPIAIIANASRVTLTGMLSEINPDFARGFFHSASGWVIFMVALMLLVAFHRLLCLVFPVRCQHV